MKWIGQHIWDFISRFRSDVYLEAVESGTIASGGNLGLDSNNKIVKADTESGELSFDGLTPPVLLNPMRAETVRDDDAVFQDQFKKWKANELTPEEFQQFQSKIRELIVHQDLYMLQVCDTNLINFDGTAGAGTFGEAQISALKNQQVFLWLTNGMKLSNVSPWLLPSVTKVLVDDELWPFLSNFK